MAKIEFACYSLNPVDTDFFFEGSAERRHDEVEQETPVSRDIPLSDRARQAIEFAIAEAKRRGNEEVTPEHLLLGLIREQRALPAKLPSDARVRKMLTTCSVVRMSHLILVEEPKRKEWRRRPSTRNKGLMVRLMELMHDFKNEIF